MLKVRIEYNIFLDICGMRRFIVVVPLENETSITFANACIYHILLKFVLYHLVVIDDGNPFKESSTIICDTFYNTFERIKKNTI